MFVAAYWWKVQPGKEEQFRTAWRRAEWPDEATWQKAFDAKMVYDEPDTRAAFTDAVADTADEPLLLMTVTDDLLDRD